MVGERQLGGLDGVLATRIGSLGGREVVEAKGARVDTGTQQQYDLAQDPAYHYLPLTTLQATKVNAALGSGESPDGFLSPSQRALHDRLAKDVSLLARLKRLAPDRSPDGISAYAADLERMLDAR